MSNLKMLSNCNQPDCNRLDVDDREFECKLEYNKINNSDLNNNNLAETARFIAERYIENFEGLKGLEEFQNLLKSCIPEHITKSIENELVICNCENNAENNVFEDINFEDINIDGFANFRLPLIKKDLDAFIMKIIRLCMIREKGWSILNKMRQYVNEMPIIADELYITAEATEREEAATALDLMLEFLPRKIIIFVPKKISNMKFIDSIQYIFGNRVILKNAD